MNTDTRRCIGIDGCPGGWVAATCDGIARQALLADLLAQLHVVPGQDVVAIDMPIGLVERGKRDCDVQARAALGAARRNSVFWTPTRRAVIQAVNQTDATRINREQAMGGVSAQAYNLFDKIREVDRLLADAPKLRTSLYEVHPELAFASWQADTQGKSAVLRPMRHPKKSALGAFDRLTLVFARYRRDLFEQARRQYPAKLLADDDIADAYAALYSAERIATGTHVTLPSDPPPRDAHDLPVRICY